MTNNEIKKEWEILSGEEMLNMIERAAREVIRQRPNMAKTACVSAAELAGEAWIRIDEWIEAGKEFETVEKMVIRAAQRALEAAARFNEHSAGSTGGDDLSTDQADSLSDKLNARDELSTGIKRPVENAVINKLSIDAAALDERDNRIIDGLKQGLTLDEIGHNLNISRQAVIYRKNKIASRIADQIDDQIDEQELQRECLADEQMLQRDAKIIKSIKAAALKAVMLHNN